MYIGIYDSKRVTNVSLKGNNSILIRILEPSGYSNDLPIINYSSYQDILELYLPDYIKKINTQELTEIFSELNQFILDNDFDEIIIHCSLGISRSPAIMICIAKIINNLELEELIKDQYKFYNKFIVQRFENYPYLTKEIEDKEIIHDYQSFFISNDDSLETKNVLQLIRKKK